MTSSQPSQNCIKSYVEVVSGGTSSWSHLQTENEERAMILATRNSLQGKRFVHHFIIRGDSHIGFDLRLFSTIQSAAEKGEVPGEFILHGHLWISWET